jgi:hypothetical protein
MHVQPLTPRHQPNRVQARAQAAGIITAAMPASAGHLVDKAGFYQEKAAVVGWYRGGWRFYVQLQDVHRTKETAMGMAKL